MLLIAVYIKKKMFVVELSVVTIRCKNQFNLNWDLQCVLEQHKNSLLPSSDQCMVLSTLKYCNTFPITESVAFVRQQYVGQ